MKKHIIKEEDILAEDKRFSEFENQDIIKEFYKTKFALNGGSSFECCDYEAMYNELETLFVEAKKAISQTQKEAYEKGRLETIKEIEEKLPNVKNEYGTKYEDLRAFRAGFNSYNSQIKSILNQLKDNGKY